ncbi:MAG: PHP domain-containing protein [Proteobacteria bacterium]|nr:PHP domain-containing protein [Pseudomonadota bacterium]
MGDGGEDVIADRGSRIEKAGLLPDKSEIPKPQSEILADLHIHTVLSPCAEVEMIPPHLVRRALDLGLELIAVTDHNAAENCAAVIQAAAGTGLTVLPGMEVQTSEEVHVLCWFDTVEQALTWQGIVFNHLPKRNNPEEVFGAQYVVDAGGDYLRTETQLLLTSTDLTLSQVIKRVQALGGLAVPAHVDRPSFSLLANLGFVPADLQAPALELSRLTDPAEAVVRWPDLAHWPLIRGSDTHRLSEMAPSLRLYLDDTTLAEMALALAGQDGRRFAVLPRNPVDDCYRA